jgi:hypothetical protein
MKNLKKADFIRFAYEPDLAQSVIRMLKYNWVEIIKKPSLISEKNFTTSELESLACMNIRVYTEKALELEPYDDGVRYVFGKILDNLSKEVKSLI